MKDFLSKRVSNNNKGVGLWRSDELNDETCCQADGSNRLMFMDECKHSCFFSLQWYEAGRDC